MPDRPHHTGARSPEFALLGFLYETPNHGYNLHQLLVGELGHVWHISQSQTYNILKRLEAQALVSSSTQEQAKLPARQLLQITDAGRHKFTAWLRAPSGSSVRAIRLEFITRLYFAQRFAPERLIPIIDEESAEVTATLARLKKDREALGPEQTFNRLGLELRIRQLYSVLEWLAECRKTFEVNS